MLNSVREAVEDGLTNTMLIDEVLAMKVETEEGKQILGTLDGQGKRPPQSIDIASIFYSLRSLSDLLERINRYINEEHH
ncbi:hypothetical protein [Bergeyella zoohelcum]|uniref:hypothetical protein n=1 Tax=Bergeyella zoohelcum TaxID=1015 RepID=UPI002A90C055|nr:hypothetical protein [Bergeyella zoohelcum]MDY6024668.1 hypothetical protein [Bergeyella zoohelcum]